jgi:hypothetical protein
MFNLKFNVKGVPNHIGDSPWFKEHDEHIYQYNGNLVAWWYVAYDKTFTDDKGCMFLACGRDNGGKCSFL